MRSLDKNTIESKSYIKILPGLEGLENYVDYDEFVYILRAIYRIIFRSGQLKESKEELAKRIARFEKQANLPEFLSSTPLEKLLEQLEDAQYYYSIYRREQKFPTFH